MTQTQDPERIPRILEAIRLAWSKQPDLRLGQLLVNAIRPKEPCPGIFYAKDEALLEALARLGAATTPVTLQITGWQVGLRKVSHTMALQQFAGMSLQEAGDATHALLDGRIIDVTVADIDLARRLASALRDIGAVVRLPDEPASDAP